MKHETGKVSHAKECKMQTTTDKKKHIRQKVAKMYIFLSCITIFFVRTTFGTYGTYEK